VRILGNTNYCIAATFADSMQVPLNYMEAENGSFDDNFSGELNRKIVAYVNNFNPPPKRLLDLESPGRKDSPQIKP